MWDELVRNQHKYLTPTSILACLRFKRPANMATFDVVILYAHIFTTHRKELPAFAFVPGVPQLRIAKLKY